MLFGRFGSVPSGLGRGTSVAKLLSGPDSSGSSSAGTGGKFCGSGDTCRTDGCIGGSGCLGVSGTLSSNWVSGTISWKKGLLSEFGPADNI